MYDKDSKLIWEAYADIVQEGWGKNLAMMGMGAMAAYGAMKHNPALDNKSLDRTHQKVSISPKRSPDMQRHMQELDYNKALAKALKRNNWISKYYVPVDDKTHEPLLDFKTLNKIRKQYNQSPVSEEQFRAAQNTFGR